MVKVISCRGLGDGGYFYSRAIDGICFEERLGTVPSDEPDGDLELVLAELELPVVELDIGEPITEIDSLWP